MKHIRENITFLKAVADLSENGQYKDLLKKATRDQVTAIAEIASNVLARVLSLSFTDKTNLHRHRAVIRRLGDKATSYSVRQAIISSHSKVIRLLIKAVIKKLVAIVQ